MLTWNLPPVIGLSFIVGIGILSVEQVTDILLAPLEPFYILAWIAFTVWYFSRYIRPITRYLDSHNPSSEQMQAAMQCLYGFPLRYWGLFLLYLLIAPVTVIVSAEIYTDYVSTPVDWFRIELIALIISIIVGLPIFFLIMDLFGQALGSIPLPRPFITMKTKVFLIAALTPLLIDTLLIQYYWTRTGFFNVETFFVWVLLEVLAIAGSLIFVHSFSQSLRPLQDILYSNATQSSLPVRLAAQSTDEIGVLAQDYQNMLSKNRENQQRNRFHIEKTPLGVVEFNTNVETVEWNPAAEKIFGYSRAEAIGKNAMQLIVPESAHTQVDVVWENLVSNSGGEHSVNENSTKDGRTILCKWENTTLLNSQGEVIGVASVVEDITTRARDEALLRQRHSQLEEMVRQRTQHLMEAKEEAMRANSAKSDFLSRMSHELRTPMNAVLGFAQLLHTDEKLATHHKESVHEILKAGDLLLELINEMLDLAQIEAGKLHVNVQEVPLKGIILDSLSIITPMANEQAIRIIDNSAHQADCIVLSESTRLKEVLINLLSNAIKYNSDNGSVTLDVRHHSGNLCRISILDTGPGLSAADQQHIFEPFSRLESHHHSIQGVGIGLTITRRLVELMGGTMGIDSTPGKGSCFYLDLKLANESDQANQPATTGI